MPMWYVSKRQLESGGYGNPQSNKFNEAYELKDSDLNFYVECMGFVNWTDDGNGGWNISKNEEAYDAYQEYIASLPEPEPYDPLEHNDTINFLAEAITSGVDSI